jgi:ABC-type nitrate/sulfonate/bicarbonate transport system, ATPase component
MGDSKGLVISNVKKEFELENGKVLALHDINLKIKEGEFVSIVGASGCGKSTLLRIIGGLETQTEGIITLNGEEIRGPGFNRGMVFQESRLFPWLSVRNNVLFWNLKKGEKRIIQKRTVRTGGSIFEAGRTG